MNKINHYGGGSLAQNYTRKVIRDAFFNMLNERPLNKITVKDIVTACEINRNTFYYYYTDVYAILSELFQTELQRVIDEYNDTLSWEEGFLVAAYYYYTDVYAILSELFQTELQRVIDEYNDTLSWEEGFLVAARFALNNKKAIYHVYNSMQKEELENYIYKVSGNVMERYVERVSSGIMASSADKKLIASFYQSALTEMVHHWIASGMKEDPDIVIRRIGQLFDGNIVLSLKRSASLSNTW